jgi:hypothetical protein
MELPMKDPDRTIKEAARRATGILAEYLQPGERNCEVTIERLMGVLDNDYFAEAMAESDAMERHDGGRQDEQRPAGQVAH